MIVTVTLNAALDHVIVLEGLKLHETNRTRLFQTDAGGKGINVSRVLTQLGAKNLATGLLGGTSGATVRSILRHEAVEHEFVKTHSPTRTNVNIESGDGPPTTFNSPGGEVTAVELAQLVAKCQQTFAGAQWVVLAGSLPPGVPQTVFAELTQIAKRSGAKVALDSDGGPMALGIEAGPDLIKPNASEASRLLESKIQGPEQAIAACNKLADKMKAGGAQDPVVVLSQGSEGAVLVHQGQAWAGDAIPVQAVSTVGAGDSMVAGLLAAAQKGQSWHEALTLGLAAGAATAMTDGSGIGTGESILLLQPQATVRPWTRPAR